MMCRPLSIYRITIHIRIQTDDTAQLGVGEMRKIMEKAGQHEASKRKRVKSAW